MKVVFITKNKEETKELGKKFSSLLNREDVILLKGDLGAGKTTFVSGVAKGLGIEDDIISPTFNIMKCYFNGRIPLYHIDAYRLEDQNVEIGLDEYIEGDGACFIEWPQFIEELIPDEVIEITLKTISDTNREITIESENKKYEHLLNALKEGL